MASSAQDRVLHTPELLEAILLQLTPLHTLLHAQLINTHFRTSIRSSPRLQQRLFLRAQPSSPNHHGKLTINPLLRQHFLPFFLLPVNRFSMPDYTSLTNLDWATSSKSDAFLRKDASWRAMLIVQPPPRQLKVVQFTHAMRADFKDEAVLSFAGDATGGVTMGAVYDIVESFLASKRVGGFGLAIQSGDAEGTTTQMTLHLTFTKQCCQRDVKPAVAMRSLGATKKTQFHALELSPVGEEKVGGGRRESKRLGIDWETDLSAEDGLMGLYEWEEWKRERASIADLMSDVRA